VKLRNASTGALKGTQTHAGAVECIAFSRDGRLLASGDGGSVDGRAFYGNVCLWDAGSGELLRQLRLDNIRSAGSTVYSVSLSPDEFPEGQAFGSFWRPCLRIRKE
jgi:WD40 repeat protein